MKIAGVHYIVSLIEMIQSKEFIQFQALSLRLQWPRYDHWIHPFSLRH